MTLIGKLPDLVSSVSIDRQTWIPFQQLVDHEAFEGVIGANQVYHRNIHGHQHQLDISDVQGDVDSQKTYLQRKEEIEGKAEESKSQTLRRIRDLRAKIATLRTTKFNELVRSSTDRANDLFDGFGEKGELARFLILEGHLDDTYYQYTSLFHSGRLSPSDNKFLIQIRAFVTPDPGFQIDNPKEVIAAMRDEDFGQSYVLNVKLVDCLLSEANRYSDHIRSFFEFIASGFDDCEDFLEAYYATGRDVAGLLSGLVEAWKEFIPRAIASKHSLSHVTQFVKNLPEEALKTLASEGEEFSGFVAANLPEILALVPDLAPERLERIGFEVRELPAIGTHTGIVRFMVAKELFELSIANLEHVFSNVLGETNLTAFRERNYTTLRSITDPALRTRVERDFDVYLSNVLLNLSENSKEDAAAMIDVLCREELDENNLRDFLGQQTTLLPTLDGVPERRHAMVFELQRIVPTWTNCIAFMEGSGFAAEILVAYLNAEDVRSNILSNPLANNPETLRLRQFLVNADGMSDDAYREYVRALPNSFRNFPTGVSASKLTILIQEHKITFSKESLDTLDDGSDLPVLFVAQNIGPYLANPNSFALDDDFREALLKGHLSDDEKRAIIDLMDINAVTESPELAALIGPILDRTNVGISGLVATVAGALIQHSKPVRTQISLLNKFQGIMTVDDVCQTLVTLPEPFSEITRGYHTPRLPKSDQNRELVQWLDSRDIISSWGEGGGWFSGDEIRVNLKRR